MSFRREKHLPRGGPDGGDGGKGGDFYVVARQPLTTLDHLGGRRLFAAGKGQPGGAQRCHGRNGLDYSLEVPAGTIVRDHERGHILAEVMVPDEPVLLLKGGRGGRGNFSYRSSVHQAPRKVQTGGPPEVRKVGLELKLLADVGLIGLPNAGKSTLLSRLSAARPKIGNYPFTTLKPRVGTVEVNFETITVADLPGLLEGAHEGRGLGARFLRHIERTRAMMHLIDASERTVEQIVEAYGTVHDELRAFAPGLDEKSECVVLTKLDLRTEPLSFNAVREALQREVLPISSMDGRGIAILKARAFELGRRRRQPWPDELDATPTTPPHAS